MARVVVLGGGISGLAAAHRLRELSAARNVALELKVIERGRAGGCIETLRDGRYLMEMGAESLPRQKPQALTLIEGLGLRDQLIATRSENKGTLIATGARLRRLPEDFSFFTPGSLASLLTSGLFGTRGTLRAAFEPFVPARRSGTDESVAAFVSRRMGNAVLERLAQPIVGGIYSGDPQRMSMQATLPTFLEMERKSGSLVRGLKAVKRPEQSGLLTLRDGMQTLVDTLKRELRPDEFFAGEAVAVARTDGDDGAWMIALSDGTRLSSDALVCALPAHEAARLLGELEPRLGSSLREIRYNSIAVITLAFSAAGRLPRAHGVLVPFVEHRHVTAITLSSLKYADRAPKEGTLLRAYAGGALQRELLQRSDAELVDLVRSDVRDLLRIEATPDLAIVRRWIDALPEYEVGHLERVETIDRSARALPRFALAGAAYRGVGVSDCIASARAAAQRIIDSLAR